MQIRGAVVVVTGASSGIGRETALALAGKGARLVLAARRAAELEESANDCRSLGGDCRTFECDVAEERKVEALARFAVETYGRIDAWVNNAGIYAMGTLQETPEKTFPRIIHAPMHDGSRSDGGWIARKRRSLANAAKVAGAMPASSARCCLGLRAQPRREPGTLARSDYEYSRETTSPGRGSASRRPSASITILFCSASSRGRPSEWPGTYPFGESARGGRACALSSASTVMRTVGIPCISIARCTVTTVRWQSRQPPVRSTRSGRAAATARAICGTVVSRTSFKFCEKPIAKC